jgi:hypothetical protein
MGYGLPAARSQIFQEADTLFTMSKSDFSAPVVGASLAFMLDDRLDLAVELSYSESENWSEYVDWVEEGSGGQEIPIEQKTSFRRVPVSLSVRYYLRDRGREISRLAWVPAKWSPYVGAGLGRMYYRFAQSGDFVDFLDNSIFYGEMESSGSSWSGHLLAGAQYSLSRYFLLTGEARYSWSNAELDRYSYSGYDPIDLSGLQATMGIGVRF